MAPTTISVARVMELGVPLAWQEAVEVVHALETASTAQGTLITIDAALISTDGTVLLAPSRNSNAVSISPLRLLGRLLEGVTTPPELRALVGSEIDALSGFPSEGGGGAPKMLTINWFTRPNGASLIGRLAARAIAAHAAASGTTITAQAAAPAPDVSPLAPAPVESPLAVAPRPAGGFAPPSPAFVPTSRQSDRVPIASPPLAQVPKPAPPAKASEVVAEGAGLEAFPAASAASLERLREEIAALPASRGFSPIAWLRANAPSGRNGVFAAACAATFLMVVTTWAWLPLRPSTPLLSTRGPLLGRSALVGFAPTVGNDSPLAPATSSPALTTGSPSPTPRTSREREAVALVAPAPASSRSGDERRVTASNGHPSTGYRSEPAVESAPLTMASPPARPVAPPAPAPSPARASSDVRAAPPASAATRTAPAGVPVDRRIYSAADEGVEPPTMVRQQMPSEPKPDSEVGDSWVEVVVDESGQVAQVRLHSSDLSLNDRMIVSAAKAWQFQPALKDGRPVKYMLRLPVVR